MNYYDPNTEIGKDAQAIDSPDTPNELSVGGHGIRGTMNDDSTGTRDFLDPDKLADRLEDPVLAGKLNRAKYVKLYSCHIGEGPSFQPLVPCYFSSVKIGNFSSDSPIKHNFFKHLCRVVLWL